MSEPWFHGEDMPAAADWNMAMDDLLLQRVAELGRPLLRFYAWSEPAATFGYFQHYTDIAAWTSLRPLIRRPTGGGLVQHDADWTYSLAFPPSHPWFEFKAAESYKALHDWLRRSFERLGVTTQLAVCCQKEGPGQCFIGSEPFDLLWNGRKIAGAAQRRTRGGLLIQGSVQNLAQACTRAEWQEALRQTAPIENRVVEWSRMEWDPSWLQAAADLIEIKYASPAYNQKR